MYIGQRRVITRAQTASPKMKIDGIRNVSSPSDREQNTVTGKDYSVHDCMFLFLAIYICIFGSKCI